MEYIGNNEYKLILNNGAEVICSALDLQEGFKDILRYEGKTPVISEHLPTVPYDVVFAESIRYELLVTEIKDSGWKDLKWSQELEQAFEVVFECTREGSREYYEYFYNFIKKD